MTRAPLAVVLAAGLALTPTGSGAATTARADTTPEFGQFAVDGQPAEGQPSPSGAPNLVAGQYVDTVPANGADKFYRLSRKKSGSVLHVGVSTRPGAASGNNEALVIRLRTIDNHRCGSAETYDNDHQAVRRNSVLSAATMSWPENAAIRQHCLNDEELLLRISTSGESAHLAGRPFELTVTEEPATTGSDAQLPPPADAAATWEPMTAAGQTGTTTQLTGGHSFNDAAALRAGTYQSAIFPGEARFFRVPLRWGQHLQAYARLADPAAVLRRTLDEGEQTITLRVFGPTRGWANAESSTVPASVGDAIFFGRDTNLSLMTLPVRYNNRTGQADEQRATALAGDYYLMVTLSEDKDGQTYAVPFELSVNVVGEPVGAPSYAAGQEVIGPGASPLSTAGTDAAPQQRQAAESDGSNRDLIRLLTSIGLALLAFGAITLSTTRRRKDEDEEPFDADPDADFELDLDADVDRVRTDT